MSVTTVYRDFAEEMARTEGIPHLLAKQLCRAFVRQLEARLRKGERIRFGALFSLVPAMRGPQNRYIPATGERLRAPSSRILRLAVQPGFRDDFGAGTQVAGLARPAPRSARKPSKDLTPKKKVSQRRGAK